jgi:hypothetical protein
VCDVLATTRDARLPYRLGPFPLEQFRRTDHAARFALQLYRMFLQILATDCDSHRKDVQSVVGSVIRSDGVMALSMT